MLGPRGFLRLRGAWMPGIAPLPPDGSAVAWTRPGRSVLSECGILGVGARAVSPEC